MTTLRLPFRFTLHRLRQVQVAIGVSVLISSGSAWADPPAPPGPPAERWPLESEGAESSPPETLDYDDFSVPDDASFEPYWDSTAYPDLAFTTAGCGVDIVGGRRTNGLGVSWFVGAFLSISLGRGCGVSRREEAHWGLPLWLSSSAKAEGAPGIRRVRADTALESPAVAEVRATSPSAPAGSNGDDGRRDSGSSEPTNVTASASGFESPGSLVPGFSSAFVTEMVARVRRASGTIEEVDRLLRLGRQERKAGLLPELRLRGAHGIDQSVALETVGSFSGEATSKGGSDSVVEARLTFHLDRLLAPQNATAFERLRRDVLERQTALVQESLELLSVVLESDAMKALDEISEEERVKYWAKGQGARLRLHVLTGGWFPLESSRVARIPLEATPAPVSLPADLPVNGVSDGP